MAEKTQSAGIANSLTGDTLANSFQKRDEIMMSKQRYTFTLFLLIFSMCIYAQTGKPAANSSTVSKEYPFLKPKDFTVKQFLEILIKKYDSKSKINSVTFSGEFPENWVKDSDVKYLLSVINSQKKCCGYMNAFSSYISNDHAEVGGFATIFLNSYLTKKRINLGLNSNPKANKKDAEEIINLIENNNPNKPSANRR